MFVFSRIGYKLSVWQHYRFIINQTLLIASKILKAYNFEDFEVIGVDVWFGWVKEKGLLIGL